MGKSDDSYHIEV